MKKRTAHKTTSSLVKRLNAESDNNSFAFIYITNECQLNCAHCSFTSGMGQHSTRIDEQVLLSALDELKGMKDITLTGGEPTLHPSFKKILTKSSEHAEIVYVMTNGINLVGKDMVTSLYKKGDRKGLQRKLKDSLDAFPENVHLFFPLDSFHLRTFRPFHFLIQGLADLAGKWNSITDKAFIGFLSNEVSKEKSKELIGKYKVASCAHIGTAQFAPWRKSHTIEEWYLMHPMNRMPLAGGLYLNFKGVYLNEASLLMELREEIETDLKIGTLDPVDGIKNQLEMLYGRVPFSLM